MPTPKKYAEPMTEQILVRLTPELLARAQFLAALDGMGTADVARAALMRYYEERTKLELEPSSYYKTPITGTVVTDYQPNKDTNEATHETPTEPD